MTPPYHTYVLVHAKIFCSPKISSHIYSILFQLRFNDRMRAAIKKNDVVINREKMSTVLQSLYL